MQDPCLGEWKGRGKTINISKSGDELLVEMGPGVPLLTLVSTSSSEEAGPMTWAVVRRTEGGRPSATSGTVYIFELPSTDSMRLLVKKPSGDGVVEFERVEPVVIEETVAEASEPEKASSPRAKSKSRSRSPRPPPKRGKMSFADSLARIVSAKKVVHTDREKLAANWLDYESKLLDQAVELFKQRCVREAENQRCKATINFEVLSREIDDFPKRTLSGSTYYVGTWGEGLCAESWFYATRGVTAPFSSSMQVLFAEVLQGMLPKFVERVRCLGFQTCSHEAGTWKITVSWKKPDPETLPGEANDA